MRAFLLLWAAAYVILSPMLVLAARDHSAPWKRMALRIAAAALVAVTLFLCWFAIGNWHYYALIGCTYDGRYVEAQRHLELTRERLETPGIQLRSDGRRKLTAYGPLIDEPPAIALYEAMILHFTGRPDDAIRVVDEALATVEAEEYPEHYGELLLRVRLSAEHDPVPAQE